VYFSTILRLCTEMSSIPKNRGQIGHFPFETTVPPFSALASERAIAFLAVAGYLIGFCWTPFSLSHYMNLRYGFLMHCLVKIVYLHFGDFTGAEKEYLRRETPFATTLFDVKWAPARCDNAKHG
jgi:hypothetical protein